MNAAGAPIDSLHTLTTRQRAIVTVIDDYTRVTGEPCPASYLARRLRLHHSSIQEHLSALHRKGWLRTPNSPIRLRFLLS
jgi:DNA-binding IclR family transcriptional regulator